MKENINLNVKAKLDPNFTPLSLVINTMREATKENGQDIVIAVIRDNGYTSVYNTRVFKDGTGHDDENFKFIERITKTLLWIVGGYKIVIAGSFVIGEYIKNSFSRYGIRNFDINFMEKVYEKTFEVEIVALKDAPKNVSSTIFKGKNLDGCRIGFDAGGSDRKVSAIVNGKCVYSEEIVWYPKTNSNPDYHYKEILEAMKTAASKMPRVDAIGVSSAGVCIDNKIKVSSLFLKVSEQDFNKKVKNMYLNIAKEIGENIPVEVANDGDVAALAGAISLNDNGILGISMGTSEAGGYIDMNGNVTGWLNELAFVPIDYNQKSAVDEWSGDYGCGSKYFSQEGVIKLAEYAGVKLSNDLSPAEKLKKIQNLMDKNSSLAADIYNTIGVYLGYSIAYYCEFYDIKHILIMGRVTSGKGGNIILKKAQEVLEKEFPELANIIKIHIPNETERRIGQSIAAASLPKIR